MRQGRVILLQRQAAIDEGTCGAFRFLATYFHNEDYKAAAWCDFLEAHARRVYQSAYDADTDAAATLAERIKASLPNPFTYRQVAQKGWTGLGTVEDVRRAVGYPEDRGWLRVVEVPAGAAGGRPSEHVHIHSDLLKGKPEGGQS